MSQDANLPAYFERIGFAGSIAPNLQTLQALHEAHPAHIPFENLSPLIGEPVRLDQESLEAKLLHQRRGGYGLEHNMLFYRVLKELGYDVRAHFARVLWERPAGHPEPHSHMVLSLDINGVPYLADVGFIPFTLTAPLRLRGGIEQPTPHETFRISAEASSFQLEVLIGDAWHKLYAFDLAEMIEADFEAPNFYFTTHPSSPLLSCLKASRSDKGRRINLLDQDLTIRAQNDESQVQRLDRLEVVKAALTDLFGIVLPSAEQLDPVLSRLLENKKP